ncbi:hypothetical protein J3U35_02215 [Gilliamella sp. B2717]|uniref:3-hydroxybutyrate oligomer hydrolase family protein n=1 Tax=unclassified Gilliamella TaxID=2685620 RepID=UPI002269EA61|nr:3-hydroxybutyrate oligomer hydrolase family protein [Gilliamella sp. B2717]MCX8578245.1 hypothetical protein [Gilliamella sp. B2717]
MQLHNFHVKTLLSLLLFSSTLIPISLHAQQDIQTDSSQNYSISAPDWLLTEEAVYYDGDSDDLVTAGLGFTTLSTSIYTPHFSDPTQPTIQELRQAKLNRFININNGEGSLFGFRRQELSPLFDGKIPGFEILATLKLEQEKVGMLLQIPLDFDKNKPCIVAVPATDSDGLYNAKDVQIRGLWGLRHNCAVVYNDKGLGNGIYDIEHKRGYAINGHTQSTNLLFEPTIFNRDRFIKKYPNRYAIKQLHSRLNSEERWGEFVLKSIEFAFYALNTQFPSDSKFHFNKDNTIVLVYGASDGGGAALKAGELDTDNVIKGIVAVNPQIQPNVENSTVSIQYNKSAPQKIDYKSIADYSSYASLYIPCAIPAIVAKHKTITIPFADKYLYSQNRCDALKKENLLTKGTPEEALEKLHSYGWTPSMDIQLPYFYYKETIGLPYQYISAYGHFDVTDRMCGYSVASTQQNPINYQGKVASLHEVTFQQLWSFATGHLPIWLTDDSTALALVNNEDAYSPRSDFFSGSDNKKAIDYNAKGAICLYKKLTHPRVKFGINQVSASANLHGTKTLIVHARHNVKQLPDYTARAYVALNSQVEGNASQLRYYEIENTSYLDGTYPFDNSLLPIDYYGEDAMEWLWFHLTNHASLPESQVVRAKARGGKIGFAPQLTENTLVPISQTPNQKDLITTENGKIILPN